MMGESESLNCCAKVELLRIHTLILLTLIPNDSNNILSHYAEVNSPVYRFIQLSMKVHVPPSYFTILVRFFAVFAVCLQEKNAFNLKRQKNNSRLGRPEWRQLTPIKANQRRTCHNWPNHLTSLDYQHCLCLLGSCVLGLAARNEDN